MKFYFRPYLFLLLLFSLNINVLAKAMHEETSKHDADIRVMDALNNCHKQQDGGSDKNSCKTNFECKANHLFQLPVSPLSTLTAAGPVYDFPPSCFLLHANNAVWRPPMS